MSDELKKRVEALSGKIAIDLGMRGFDDSAAVIYENDISGSTIKTTIEDKVVIKFISEQLQLIEELTAREARLIGALNHANQALTEINHAHLSPNWFTDGAPAANKHLRSWIARGKENIAKTLAELNIKEGV